MAQATISKVSLAQTSNGPRIVLTLSDGNVQWYPTTYISKLLEANFLGGMRPTVLVGTPVSFTKVNYKKGDFSVDNAGVATNVKHEKDGSKLIKFEFGEIVGNVSKVDEAHIMANAMAAASVKAQSAFSKAKAVAASADEEEEEEEEDDLPAAKTSKKVK